MSGFYAGLPASWELIVSSGLIPKPWAREHAVNDLRYHMDLVRLGRVAGLPTRRALEERWGWSWRAVERLVYAPSEWADDRGLSLACSLVEAARGRALKLVGQERARSGPGAGQERASQKPANARNAAEVGQERARSGPGAGQERATRDQDLRARDHRSQITDHRSQDPEEEIRGPQQVEQQPLPATPPRPTEPQKRSPAPKGQVALLAPPPAAPAGPKGKKQPAVPAIREADLQPDEREALLAFRRLLDSMIGQPRCDWVRRPEDEMWLVELHREVADAIDVSEELKRMQDWLDGHLRRKQAGKSSKFPAMFKPFIRNWLTRQRDEPRHTDRDRDAAYRGVPDGYKPMRMDSNVNYGPRQPHELTEAERAELDRLPF